MSDKIDYDAPFVTGTPQAPRQPNWVRFDTRDQATVIINAQYISYLLLDKQAPTGTVIGMADGRTFVVDSPIDQITADIDELTIQNARGE